MVPDLMLQKALSIGMTWLTQTVQPDGAGVHPRGAYVVLADRGFEFGVDPGGRGVTVTVSGTSDRPVDKMDRLTVERFLAQLGYGVIAHEGFLGESGSGDQDEEFSDDFGRVVVSAQPHPSLRAALDSYAQAPFRSGRPASVPADFTTVLEVECELLRERLRVVQGQLASTLDQLRALGGVR